MASDRSIMSSPPSARNSSHSHSHVRSGDRRELTFLQKMADRLGICLSALCVIHCLAMPLAILLIPALQFSVGHDLFHVLLVVILPLLAILAFVPGFKQHRDSRVFYWAIPGLILIVTGASFEGSYVLQGLFSIPGSLCLIRAHWLNRHLCACCRSGHGRVTQGPNSLADIHSDL